MFTIEGRILTINLISEKSAQIVLQKKIFGENTPFAINVWGFWKTKMDALKLKPKNKISGKVYIKCSLWKGKWYTELYFKEIIVIPEKQKKGTEKETDLFDNSEGGLGNNFIVDEETGEILL
jgi:hypothetical protein